MPELLRCPNCHRWSDALLVWASGDSCPSCNAEMGSDDRVVAGHIGESEPAGRVRPSAGLPRPPERHPRNRVRL